MAGRAVLVGTIVTGVALAGLKTPAEEAARVAQVAGGTGLLRAMAELKLMFAAGLLAAAYWRLAVPASTWRLASFYIVPKIRTRSVGCSRAPHATRTRAI